MVALSDPKRTAEEIISTYGFTPSQRRWVIARTDSVLSDAGLTFDRLYEFIGDLASKISSSSPESSRILFFQEACLEGLAHRNSTGDTKPIEEKRSLRTKEVLGILESILGADEISILRQIIQCNGSRDLELNLSPQDLVDNAEAIKNYIVQTAEKFAPEGKLLIPHRPIVYVGFTPFRIRFGRRRYHGDPLAFFRRHDVYRDMTKRKLRTTDKALYLALQKAGQLDQAVKGTNRSFGGDPEKYFLERRDSDFRGVETASQLRKADFSLFMALFRRGTLYNVVTKSPPPIRNSPPNKLNDRQVLEIFSAYSGAGNNVAETSRITGLSEPTIRKYLRKGRLI